MSHVFIFWSSRITAFEKSHFDQLVGRDKYFGELKDFKNISSYISVPGCVWSEDWNFSIGEMYN